MSAKEAWEGKETSFWEYGFPLANMEVFKYIGRIIPATHDDWISVVSNLRKSRKK